MWPPIYNLVDNFNRWQIHSASFQKKIQEKWTIFERFVAVFLRKVKVKKMAKQKFSQNQLDIALRLIKIYGYSVRQASRRSNIAKSTLADYVEKFKPKRKTENAIDKIPINFVISKCKMGRRPVLSETAEAGLVELLTTCAKRGFPLRMADICQIIKQYLDSIPRKVEEFAENLPEYA